MVRCIRGPGASAPDTGATPRLPARSFSRVLRERAIRSTVPVIWLARLDGADLRSRPPRSRTESYRSLCRHVEENGAVDGERLSLADVQDATPATLPGPDERAISRRSATLGMRRLSIIDSPPAISQ